MVKEHKAPLLPIRLFKINFVGYLTTLPVSRIDSVEIDESRTRKGVKIIDRGLIKLLSRHLYGMVEKDHEKQLGQPMPRPIFQPRTSDC
jgi:hypothetical protein